MGALVGFVAVILFVMLISQNGAKEGAGILGCMGSIVIAFLVLCGIAFAIGVFVAGM